MDLADATLGRADRAHSVALVAVETIDLLVLHRTLIEVRQHVVQRVSQVVVKIF